MSMIVDLYRPCGLGNVRIKPIIATKEEEVDEAIKTLMMSNSTEFNWLISLDMIPIRATPESSSKTSSSSAILSLCNSSHCLILRLHSLHEAPESLYNFLIQPGFTFVGFGIKDAKDKLEKDYGLVCKNVFEVGPSAWHYSQCKSQVFRDVFDYMMIPSMSNISKPWGCNVELTEDEIRVAVSNAYFPLSIAQAMFKI